MKISVVCGEVNETVGGEFIVIGICEESFVAPRLSVARAVKVCNPSAEVENVYVYGLEKIIAIG